MSERAAIPFAAAVEAMIDRLRARGGPAPAAVFDFDNTLIENDLGEATFHHALAAMKLRAGEDLIARIPARFGPEEVRAARDAARAGDAQALRRFRKRVAAVYYALCEDPGPAVAYPWVAQAFAGLTRQEVAEAALEAWDIETARPLGVEAWTEADGDPAPLRIHTGIRVRAPVVALLRRLAAAGLRTFICTASLEAIVLPVARRLRLPVEGVLGMRLRARCDRFTDEVCPPVTYRLGKVEAILAAASALPAFAAGDSATDLEMLEAATDLRFVVDRGNSTLRVRAAQEPETWLVYAPGILK